MKRIYLALIGIITLSFSLKAKTITITDDDLKGGETHNWTKDNTYLLDGFVYLEGGGVLNIQPGTVVKGKKSPSTNDNTSALFISRDARIYAVGTPDQPIIFTAEDDQLNGNLGTQPGLWAGLVILGRAPVQTGNDPNEQLIEGVPPESKGGQQKTAYFGPGNEAADPDDNSGILKYVSIRHTGAAISPGNEIQGLSMGAVGAGTTINYVESFASADDGYEWFGGTVNTKHLVSAAITDDSYDWDQGWRGKNQFWFAIQTGNEYDHAGEWDGAKPDDGTPYSKPQMYNCTFVGRGMQISQEQTSGTRAKIFRDAAGGTLANSIITEFPGKGLEVEDLSGNQIDSYQRLQDGDLQLLNNTWAKVGAHTSFDDLVQATEVTDNDGNVTYQGEKSEVVSHLQNNGGKVNTNDVLESLSWEPNNQLDPRPVSNDNAVSSPSDKFYMNADYRGAFDAEGGLWLKNWTALDEHGYLPEANFEGGGIPAGIRSYFKASEKETETLNVYPNPTTGSFSFDLNIKGVSKVAVEVISSTGQTVESVNYGKLSGLVTRSVNTELKPGIYMVKIRTENKIHVSRVIVK